MFISLTNGYSNNYIKKVQTTKRKLSKSKVEFLPTFTIPFISRSFTTDIRRAVQSSNLNVRIVERPQSSLKQLLVESPPYDKVCTDASKCPICSNSNAPVRCTQKDVVYQINCDLCMWSDVRRRDWQTIGGSIPRTFSFRSKSECKVL